MVILASISCLKVGLLRVYSHNLNIFKLGNVFSVTPVTLIFM